MDEKLDGEGLMEKKAWQYCLVLTLLLAIAALPNSRYQDLCKMGVWSVIFLGMVLTYSWRFMIDALSKSTIFGITVLHFVIIANTYWRIPHHNYIVIGVAIAVEYALCVLPIAWLAIRSQAIRQKK